jgi:AP-2 complex subunit mu-1
VFEFCYRFISICKSYFGKMDEESVKGNFVVIYELIDGSYLISHRCICLIPPIEVLDFGYPQNSESDTLKMYITTEEVKYSPAAVSPPIFSCYTPIMSTL